MDTLLRKNFWIVNLGFLSVAALLCAQTVGVIVAGQAFRAPSFAEGLSQGLDRLIRPELELAALARLLGMTLPGPAVVEAAVPLPAEAVHTPLNVRLVGTSHSDEDQLSLATIEDLAARQTHVFRVGDTLQGRTVTGIERLRVLVERDGRTEFIDAIAGPAGPAIATTVSVRDTTSSLRVDHDSVIIDRGELFGSLGNPEIMTSARFMPVPGGIGISAIKPGSLLAKAGAQNGDVLRRVNGFELSSPDKLLELYGKLKDSHRFEVELDRGGQHVRKIVELR